jgi:hypothetical protein
VFNVSNLTGGIFLDHSRLDEISIEIKAWKLLGEAFWSSHINKPDL